MTELDHRDNDQPGQPGLDAGQEHVVLGPEAGQRRDPGEGEHEHGQQPGRPRVAPGQAAVVLQRRPLPDGVAVGGPSRDTYCTTMNAPITMKA